MPSIIHNKWLPFKGFTAVNLFGVVFVRKGVRMNPVLMNHEMIHTRQQIEMLFLFFYLWYLVEWLIHLVRLKDRMKAYRAISFEREAYRYERDLSYLKHRPWFSWMKEK